MRKFEEVIAHYEGRKKKVLDAIAREEKDIASESKLMIVPSGCDSS